MRALLLVVLAFVLVGCSSVPVQKLELYCYSPEPARELGVVCRHDQAAEASPPERVALPPLNSASPIFFRWSLGKGLYAYRKVKGGIVWIVLDSSVTDGPYDRLYMDSNCDGSLADEQSIKTEEADAGGAPRFSMVQVLLPAKPEPTPYHLNLHPRAIFTSHR